MKKIIVLYMTAAMLCTGCGSADKMKTIDSRASANIKNGITMTYPRQTPYRQYNAVSSENNLEEKNESADIRAKRISGRLSKIKALDKATVVITGNTAIVGLELAGEPDDSTIIKIKRQVEKEVKAEDRTIDHVAVTAAPDLVKRILDMAGPDSNNNALRYDDRTEDIIT